jgi:hypothetical protein
MTPPPGCGNHTCDTGEDCDNCPSDCGACQPCPAGFGDCNMTRTDGCETNLNTAQNCGACGASCTANGGTNTCTLDTAAMAYRCTPMCDSTHADCDGNPVNGCETLIGTATACGACGVTCANPHGSTTCSTNGTTWFCTPTCDQGWAACGAAKDGCTTDVANDVDNCGGCNRACSSAHVSTRSCQSGQCAPTCSGQYANCSVPMAPAADDGCETDGTQDVHEPDNVCGQQEVMIVDEGTQVTRTSNRILPSGDVDTVEVDLWEGSHICLPGASQSYNARIVLSSPDGNIGLHTANPVTQCNNVWADYGNYICVNWQGTCGTTDDVTVYFQVYGVMNAQSCNDYSFLVEYCPEGTTCPGC